MKGQPTFFNKAIILVTGVISFAVLAGAVQDIRRNTADFMTHSSTINTRLDEHPHFSRNLASQREQKKPVVQYIPESHYQGLLNGEWKIIRILNTNGDKFMDRDHGDDEIEVSIKLVETSTVRINDDVGLEYEISFLHESQQAMALFRKSNGGYEIIELQRSFNSLASKTLDPLLLDRDERDDVLENQEIRPRGVTTEGFHDLYVFSAVDPKSVQGVIRGENVRGELRLNGGEIDELRLELHHGTEDEKYINLNYVRIGDGGVFNSQGTSGVILPNGENDILVRFATGPMADVQAIFLTRDELDEREREQYAAPRWNDEPHENNYQEDYYDDMARGFPEEQDSSDELGNTYREGYMTIDEMEADYHNSFNHEAEPYFENTEQMDEHVRDRGFAFTSQST